MGGAQNEPANLFESKLGNESIETPTTFESKMGSLSDDDTSNLFESKMGNSSEDSHTTFESKMGSLPDENPNLFESKMGSDSEDSHTTFESKMGSMSEDDSNLFESKMGTSSDDFNEQLFESKLSSDITSFDQNEKENVTLEFTSHSELVPETPTLFGEEQNINVNKTHQVHKKYIVSTIKSGVIFINQQLAHQRILYEEYLENITVKEATSQQLLFPLEVVFNKIDIELIKEIQLDLENIGFVFESISEDTIMVSGIPTSITESQVPIIIEQLLEDIKNEVPETSFSQLDIMAKSLAKSLAIRTGSILTNKEQEEIVNKLFLCKDPNISPFGKSTFISVSLDEIDKRFR
ncbi:hypothetical protein [Aureivirga sp. CE67]|uniref:hypothetical protein n=1 Tax=Aureivirga sp. CE67 TaxID=1788983 RepID=UPI00397D0E31